MELIDALTGNACPVQVKNLELFQIDELLQSGIANTTIRQVRDKGISVGESSIVDIQGGTIADVGVGVASKDGSKATLSGVRFGAASVYTERALMADERCWSPDDTPFSAVPAQLRYRLKLRADLPYKWHNVYVYSLWTDDWRGVHLPERWSWLYIALRPFLSIIRRLRPCPKLFLQNQ